MTKNLCAVLLATALHFPIASAHAGAIEDCGSGKPQKGIPGCTAVLKNKKLNKIDQANIYTIRGLMHHQNNDPKSAIQDFEKALTLNSKNFYTYQGLGFALDKSGLYPEAISAFDKAIALNPSDTTTISYRGYSHIAAKNYEKALADFDTGAKLAPDDPAFQAARGDALNKLKRYPIAIAAYSKAIKLNPKYASAYEGRGFVHITLADPDAAIQDFDTSVALGGKNAITYAGRAYARYLRNEIEAGLGDANQAVNLAPNDDYMLTTVGLGHLAAGDFAKATEMFNAAFEIDSASPYALRGAALVAEATGEADKSISLADTVLDQRKEDLRPFATRGFAVLTKGRTDEAIANFQKVLSDNNLNGDAYLGLGLAYKQSGDTEKARINLKEALVPYRLLPYQRIRAEKALAELDNDAGGKTDLETVAVQRSEPVIKAPTINADSGKRVALVIGNGTYESANSLINPARDSAAIATALKGLGFEVLEGKDLNHASMQGILQDFAEKATQADVSLFYYAGHGMQVGDKNYLIPVDAKLEKATAVDFELVDVNKSIVQFMGGEDRTGIIILDSCRDNPLARSFSRSFGRTRSGQVAQGMAPMETDDGGLLIAFATSPGDVAEDGDGQNSPFTTALLQHLNTPGLELELMMKRVKKDVFASTKKRQQPWVNSALREEVYLVGK